MLRLFLDTNVLLDAAGPTRPGHAAARELLARSGVGAELAICAGSVKDFYYIAGSARAGAMSDAARRSFIRLFLDRAEVLADDRGTCEAALSSDEPDYEDGTKRAAAEAWGADYIVSRDASRRAFERSSIPRIEPEGVAALAGLEM